MWVAAARAGKGTVGGAVGPQDMRSSCRNVTIQGRLCNAGANATMATKTKTHGNTVQMLLLNMKCRTALARGLGRLTPTFVANGADLFANARPPLPSSLPANSCAMMLSKSSTSSAAVAMWTTRSHLARPGTMDTVRSHVDTPASCSSASSMPSSSEVRRR